MIPSLPAGPDLGIGHLTMLDVAPPDLVRAAATAGFDFVGLRVAVGGPAEERWPLAPGSPMLRETLSCLHDTGLYVSDVDVLVLREATVPADLEPALVTAAELGAGYGIVMVDDDPDRAGDTLAALTPLAAAHGVRLLVEPMSYRPVRTVDQALALVARAPGAGIMIDPLHLARAGEGAAQVRRLDPGLVPCLQLCDGPLRTPRRLPRGRLLPRGQSAGADVRQHEARAWRLPPGEGELPLAELVGARPFARIGVEAPNLALSSSFDPVAIARMQLEGMLGVLAEAGVLDGAEAVRRAG
jgi:sugar phosphate isomerase/epimerase